MKKEKPIKITLILTSRKNHLPPNTIWEAKAFKISKRQDMSLKDILQIVELKTVLNQLEKMR